MSRNRQILIGVLALGFFAFVFLLRAATGPSAPASSSFDPLPSTVRIVTMDGRDPNAGITVDPINIWKDYTNRAAGVAGSIHSGEKVTMLRRVGQGVEIKTPAGVQGWVTYYFIKELQ